MVLWGAVLVLWGAVLVLWGAVLVLWGVVLVPGGAPRAPRSARRCPLFASTSTRPGARWMAISNVSDPPRRGPWRYSSGWAGTGLHLSVIGPVKFTLSDVRTKTMKKAGRN